jgi:WD40 repeat protein
MWRRIALCAGLAVTTCTFVACDGGHVASTTLPRTGKEKPGEQAAARHAEADADGRARFGKALPDEVPGRSATPPPATQTAARFYDPIVIPEARLVPFQTEEVPSQREGAIQFIGTEITKDVKAPPGAEVKPDTLGDQARQYFELKEGKVVQADQMMALLDDRLLRDEVASKEAKVSQAKADFKTSEWTRDEAKVRYDRRLKMWRENPGGIALAKEDLDGARLTYQRYLEEVVAKHAAIVVSQRELAQAQTQLSMYTIRSRRAGQIVAIKRKPGEWVKAGDPVFEIVDFSRLRIEAMIETQFRSRLNPGMQVEVENAQWASPQQTLTGHQGAVTAVAVSKDRDNPLIVSASEDNTAWVWARDPQLGWAQRRVLAHSSPVRAVACTPPGARANWCVTGCDDGTINLWDLDRETKEPVYVFRDGHGQAVTSLAFHPDGHTFASGGVDYAIILWDAQARRQLYGLTKAHRAPVTSLQFVPGSRLVSAGNDNRVRVWHVGDEGAVPDGRAIEHRTDDVERLGASPDGKHVLVDKGNTLQLVSLPKGLSEGVIRNSARAQSFKGFALFSPDGRLVVTAGAPEGRLQLWRTPLRRTRASEVEELVPDDPSDATGAAFAPDGSFLVTGARDRQVLVWQVPQGARAKPLTAEVTYVEAAVDPTARRVKVLAEIDNPDGRLTPGTTVTLVIPAK